jgi:hypothetical protein
MPTSPNNSPSEKNFTKRRTVEQGLQLADAAHAAVWRLYCEVFRLWRSCSGKKCRRHRRCLRAPAGCLMRGLRSVPEQRRLTAANEVIAGGPRRIAPATHLEWVVRREPLPALTSWRAGSGDAIRPREAGEDKRVA